MIRIILSGANGAMGKNVQELIAEQPDLTISCGIDRDPDPASKFPQYASFDTAGIEGDVIIDFSHYSTVPGLVAFAAATGTPAVICTTGLSDEIIASIEENASKVALFRSGNMSLGINLLIDLARRAAEVLGQRYDIEIIEAHHRHKVDAPSGTALGLGQAVAGALGRDLKACAVYGREGVTGERRPDTIGFATVRGGDIVGDHTLLFAGVGERVELTHKASSRATFAQGALRAAKWLQGRGPGLYDMRDVLSLK